MTGVHADAAYRRKVGARIFERVVVEAIEEGLG